MSANLRNGYCRTQLHMRYVMRPCAEIVRRAPALRERFRKSILLRFGPFDLKRSLHYPLASCDQAFPLLVLRDPAAAREIQAWHLNR